MRPNSSMDGSVCQSVRPSVSHTFHYFPNFMKFSEVITNDRSEVNAKEQGRRSKVKVTEVKTQLSRFRTVTPICIDRWLRNDAQSLK